GKWTRVASNRLLLEAASSSLIFHHYWWRPPTAQGSSILNANTGFRYHAPVASAVGDHGASESNQRVSASYVTGSHAFKVGFTTQEAWHYFAQEDSATCSVSSGSYGNPFFGGGPDCPNQGASPNPGVGVVDYTFLNGRPASLTEWAEPLVYKERL